MIMIRLLCFSTILLSSIASSQPSSPAFLTHPDSVVAYDGSIISFTCTALGADHLEFMSSVPWEFFTFRNSTIRHLTTIYGIRGELFVGVDERCNNTKIWCVASGSSLDHGVFDPLRFIISFEATIVIQGRLAAVSDLSYYFPHLYKLILKWLPPFTLPDTLIAGYNVSVTTCHYTGPDSLVKEKRCFNTFTTQNTYSLDLADYIESVCCGVHVKISAFNGITGEDNAIFVDFKEMFDNASDGRITIPMTLMNFLNVMFNTIQLCENEDVVEGSGFLSSGDLKLLE